MKILVAEPLATPGLRLLQHQPGWEVVVSNPKEFHQHLADADALIVHNAKQMGIVMKAAQARLAGKRVDGKILSEKVRAKLG